MCVCVRCTVSRFDWVGEVRWDEQRGADSGDDGKGLGELVFFL